MPREDARQILSPSQLNTLARDLLEGAFPLVWVEGELGNLSRPGSGHLYFTLKDARAQVRCALFKPKSQWLNFVPREGLRVLARGRLTLYEARGDYQLILDSLEEAGEGALRRAFEELKQKLTLEGLFETERKRPLPAFVRRLAVLTSPSGAAVRDVLSVLARRFPLLHVDVLPVPVQGEGAPAQIVTMLQRAYRSGRYDTILLARGGGSLEDLWAFNDERLVRAIAQSPVPVVSAIGHETDFSLSDFVADVRAPTPSVAAELLVPSAQDLRARLRQLQRRVATLAVAPPAARPATRRSRGDPLACDAAAGAAGDAAPSPGRGASPLACGAPQAPRSLARAACAIRCRAARDAAAATDWRPCGSAGALAPRPAPAIARRLTHDALRLRRNCAFAGSSESAGDGGTRVFDPVERRRACRAQRARCEGRRSDRGQAGGRDVAVARGMSAHFDAMVVGGGAAG
jgi:exodeoxyribonuclease VII large subunit